MWPRRYLWAVMAAVTLSLSTSACGGNFPRDGLVDGVCAAVEQVETGKDFEELLPRLFELSERAADLGIAEEDLSQAVRASCGAAVREARDVGQAYEQAREERHRALLQQLRLGVEECTDDRAVGTITNTTDEAIPNVSVTVELFDPDGIQLTSSHVDVGDLAPGEQRRWVATRSPYSLPEDFDYSVATCEPLAGAGFTEP